MGDTNLYCLHNNTKYFETDSQETNLFMIMQFSYACFTVGLPSFCQYNL